MRRYTKGSVIVATTGASIFSTKDFFFCTGTTFNWVLSMRLVHGDLSWGARILPLHGLHWPQRPAFEAPGVESGFEISALQGQHRFGYGALWGPSF